MIVEYASEALAERQAQALALSSAYTSGGRSAPPVCRNPAKWVPTAGVQVGRLAATRLVCPCTDQHDPDPTCEFATFAATQLVDLDGTRFGVIVTDELEAVEGEQVMVGGVRVTITAVGARALTAAEQARPRKRPARPALASAEPIGGGKGRTP